MFDDEFIEAVFEIAFGDNAINRGFTHEEVLKRLREFSDKHLIWEENQQ
jgi:hypothetical protein